MEGELYCDSPDELRRIQDDIDPVPASGKFFNTDELTLTVPYEMFMQMCGRFKESFLTTKTWATVQKKIARSNRTWERKTNR